MKFIARLFLYLAGWQPLPSDIRPVAACLILFQVTSEWDYLFYVLYFWSYPQLMGRFYLTDRLIPPGLTPVLVIGLHLPRIANIGQRSIRVISFDYHHHQMIWSEAYDVNHPALRIKLQTEMLRPVLYNSNYPILVSLANWPFLSQRLCGFILCLWLWGQSYILASIATSLYLTLYQSNWMPLWWRWRLGLILVGFYGLIYVRRFLWHRLVFGFFLLYSGRNYPALIPPLITAMAILSVR